MQEVYPLAEVPSPNVYSFFAVQYPYWNTSATMEIVSTRTLRQMCVWRDYLALCGRPYRDMRRLLDNLSKSDIFSAWLQDVFAVFYCWSFFFFPFPFPFLQPTRFFRCNLLREKN